MNTLNCKKTKNKQNKTKRKKKKKYKQNGEKKKGYQLIKTKQNPVLMIFFK